MGALDDGFETPRFVSSGQAELAVSSWGDHGTPIVALHPGVGDRRIWKRCVPAWLDAGYRVAAYDRRGFGETRYSEERHDDLADLRAVMSATETRPAVVVGNSLGGGLALDFALAHPDDVIALVLIAPSPTGYPDQAWQTSEAEAELDERLETAEASGDLELVNQLEVRYWLDGTEQPEGRVAGSARNLMLDMNRRALHSNPVGAAASRPAAWPRLEDIKVPTLVISGAYDLPGIGRLCRELVERLPNGRLATIEQSAHCPSLDQPDRLSDLMLAFLGSLES